MKNQTEIRRYLSVIKRAVSLIESTLEDDGGEFERIEREQAAVTPVVAPEPVSDDEVARKARQKHVADLMAIDCWPEAVAGHLMAAPTEKDQINRAVAVLDMVLDRSVEGCHFLDFGCGEGWIAREALRRGVASATGYDIKADANWLNGGSPALKFTSAEGELAKGKYEVVFLYDVLDHCEDPVGVMSRIRSCVKPGGVVYVRCHPWTARHANHAYKNGMNRAYSQLFFGYEEIAELTGVKPMFTRAEKNPVEAYRWWFKDFDIRKETFIKERVSDFFKVPAFKELLASEQNVPLTEIDDFIARMEIQFADYIIVPKK